MTMLHEIAWSFEDRFRWSPPELAGFCLCHAGAWKPLHKAGRRGGDTSARKWWKWLYST